MDQKFKKIVIGGIIFFVVTVILKIVLSFLNLDGPLLMFWAIIYSLLPLVIIVGLFGYMMTHSSKHSRLAKEGTLDFATVLFSRKAMFSINRNQITEIEVEFELPNRSIIRGKVQERRDFFNPKEYVPGTKVLIRYNANDPYEMQLATGLNKEELDELYAQSK